MNTQTISFRDKTVPDCHPSITSLSYKNVVAGKGDIFTPLMPAIMKVYSNLFVCLLVQEIRNPLGHINLSVEMLESLIKDKDLKMYLDVIKRNAIRLNNMINKHLANQQADEVQLEKFPIYQLHDKVCQK